MGDVQWQELTGDPDVLSTQAKKYSDVAGAISRSNDSLTAIMNESDTISKAMSALRELAGKVRNDINQAQLRYADTGNTLSTYATVLRHAKDQADPAAQQLRSLREQLVLARYKQADAKSTYNAKVKAYNRGREDSDSTPDDIARLKDAMVQAEISSNASDGVVAGLEEQIAVQERLWTDACGDKQTGGDRAAQEIEDTVTGPKTCALNDSSWDKWSKALDIISTVLGIASLLFGWVPFIGTALSILALVVSVIQFIGEFKEKGWSSLGSLLLAVFPFWLGKGAGVAGKILSNAAAKIQKAAMRSGNPAISQTSKVAKGILKASSVKGFSKTGKFLNFAGHGEFARSREAMLTLKQVIKPGSRSVTNQALNNYPLGWGTGIAITSFTVDVIATAYGTYRTITNLSKPDEKENC